MPLINTSSLVNALANTILSRGSAPSSFATSSNLPTYYNATENAARERANLSADVISNTPDISSAVDNIIRKNRSMGMSNNGSSDFYDIDLMYHVNPQGSMGSEPDGFRLYLIKPAKAAFDDLIGFTQKSITSGAETDTAQALAGAFGLEKDTLKNASTTINNKLEGVKQDYQQSFENLYTKGYDTNPQGNAFYSAILPVPLELVDSHSHEVDSLMLGALPRIMTAVGAGLFTGFEGKNYNKRRHGGAGAGFGAGIAELAEYGVQTAKARVGVGLNPNTETIYNAPQPRNFSFNFSLYPKNQKEKDLIVDFISRVKKHSYPASFGSILGQNQFYIFPGEVYFEFTGRFRNKLFKSLRPCIITNFAVSYSNGDQYQHFVDGSSIVYQITIGLVEVRLLDRNILQEDEDNKVDLTSEQGRKLVYGNNTFAGEAVKDFLTSPIDNPNQALNNLSGTLGQP